LLFGIISRDCESQIGNQAHEGWMRSPSGSTMVGFLAPRWTALRPPRYPRAWADTQRRFGDVQFDLARYQSNTAYLKAAVAAYELPLQHLWTREFLPLEWAVNQAKIASALLMLGELEGVGTASSRRNVLLPAHSKSCQTAENRLTSPLSI
jgi:hypothetical protein